MHCGRWIRGNELASSNLSEGGFDLNESIIQGVQVHFLCGCWRINASGDCITLDAARTGISSVAFEFQTLALCADNSDSGTNLWSRI